MNILVLNGSPHLDGNTMYMVKAFQAGAEAVGHHVEVAHVAHMTIHGCLGCDHCKCTTPPVCAQKDDMQALVPKMLQADMLVLASPVYYFTLSAQLQSVIQRTYVFDIPAQISKAALLLSSGSPGVYDAAISQYQQALIEYWQITDTGIFTAAGADNRSQHTWDTLYQFGRSL
jgi:multimeric flavodoxin WrbA